MSLASFKRKAAAWLNWPNAVLFSLFIAALDFAMLRYFCRLQASGQDLIALFWPFQRALHPLGYLVFFILGLIPSFRHFLFYLSMDVNKHPKLWHWIGLEGYEIMLCTTWSVGTALMVFGILAQQRKRWREEGGWEPEAAPLPRWLAEQGAGAVRRVGWAWTLFLLALLGGSAATLQHLRSCEAPSPELRQSIGSALAEGRLFEPIAKPLRLGWQKPGEIAAIKAQAEAQLSSAETGHVYLIGIRQDIVEKALPWALDDVALQVSLAELDLALSLKNPYGNKRDGAAISAALNRLMALRSGPDGGFAYRALWRWDLLPTAWKYALYQERAAAYQAAQDPALRQEEALARAALLFDRALGPGFDLAAVSAELEPRLADAPEVALLIGLMQLGKGDRNAAAMSLSRVERCGYWQKLRWDALQDSVNGVTVYHTTIDPQNPTARQNGLGEESREYPELPLGQAANLANNSYGLEPGDLNAFTALLAPAPIQTPDPAAQALSPSAGVP